MILYSLRPCRGVFCADCSVSQITLQMLLYTVYWVFALLSRRSTSENALCSYPSYIVEKKNIEHEHAKRQMAVKDSDSNSWFIHCNQLLHKYNLLIIYSLKQHTNSKEPQKEDVKHKIDTYVHQSWIEEGSSKSYLAYLNLHDSSVGRVHWCLKSTDHNIRGVHRALVKVNLLTDVYILQCNTAKFNQHTVSPICCLCIAAVEDKVHFSLECSRLDPVRLNYRIDAGVSIDIMSNPELLMLLLMD